MPASQISKRETATNGAAIKLRGTVGEVIEGVACASHSEKKASEHAAPFFNRYL